MAESAREPTDRHAVTERAREPANRWRRTLIGALSLAALGCVPVAPASAGESPGGTAADPAAPTVTTPTPPPAPMPVPRPRRVVGCRAASPSYRLAGPRTQRVVALTFDDGPWTTTSAVLSILERNRVPATFFVVGRQVRGNEGLLRRELADGDALGNHTYTHANASGGGFRQLQSTQGAIRRATGYTPCLFRAPYGSVSGLLIGQARAQAMNTIGWTVDPRDWSRPGTATIESRVLSAARPGAIILLHDGGGPRRETVASLSRIISTLRARGYGFETVPRLLGLTPRYAPA